LQLAGRRHNQIQFSHQRRARRTLAQMGSLLPTAYVFLFRQALLQLNARHNFSPSFVATSTLTATLTPLLRFKLSSRASVFCAARDLSEPHEASRFLRRNNRAFGSLP
jgi:hypothetical protein